jgi:hypothetical protein
MSTNPAVTRGKDGWRAKQLFPFNGAQMLCIETYKYDGRLTTRAAVNTYRMDGSYTHAFGLAGGGDFSERVTESRERATEKSVSNQHAQAVAMLPGIIERAKAHYAKYPARAAA